MFIKRIRKWIIALIVLSAIVSILLSPLFTIKKVYIKESGTITHDDIYQAIDVSVGDNIFVSLLRHGNLLSLEYTNLIAQLSANFKTIKNIEVKAILPDQLTINYDIAEQALEMIKGDKYIVTDEDGYVLDVDNNHIKGRVKISGLSFDNYTLYEYINADKTKLENVKTMYSELFRYDSEYYTAFREYINWIDVSSDENIAIMYDDRVLVKIKATSDLPYKIASMCVILSQQVGPGEKGVLDMTKGDSSIFSPK